MERPAIVEQEHLEYLDELRESGVTNMYGAGAYVQSQFSMTKQDATEVLMYWMNTFGEDDR